METAKLKKFAQAARRELIQQVAGKLGQVLEEGSLARREQSQAVRTLEKEIEAHGREEVVERVAYTWFNRLCALRFMDAHGYNTIRIVSPAEGQSQPEILAEAKSGHIDARTVPENVQERVFALLERRSPSADPQGEAYRLLLVAVCNHWHKAMPFLFESIADYTELLMPDDLLSDGSVRTKMRTVMTEDDCQDVEIIGWLYQFYISEKKDDVFASLKKGKKITPENIPAATQLFTPHWIVRYLVENSLGRLWLHNRPQSKLAERMVYHISPRGSETDFLRVDKPEDIRICDPACGSGHMLTYAFDLLHSIYEEEGYNPSEIPGLILKRNLYGIEIDDRAGALAAFALMMKAAERLGRRKFLRLDVQPNIFVLQNVRFSEDELDDYMAEVGRDLFTAELRETLSQFEHAKHFGSLIRPAVTDAQEVRRVLVTKDIESSLFLRETHLKVKNVLGMANALCEKHHVVVTNPPYMGGKGMNARLKKFAKDNYAGTKSNLFSMFMEDALRRAYDHGYAALMTPFVWMYISNYENLRAKLLEQSTVTTLVQLDYDSYADAKAHPCAFVLQIGASPDAEGLYIYLEGFKGSEMQPIRCKEAISDHDCSWSFLRRSDFFKSIPGQPLAFWAPDSLVSIFNTTALLGETASCVKGLDTCDNDQFMRAWHEVEVSNSEFHASTLGDSDTSKVWYPYDKGGNYRKWYGNKEYMVNWQYDGQILRNLRDDSGKMKSIPRNTKFYFRTGIAFGAITSAELSCRYMDNSIFGGGGNAIFAPNNTLTLGILNSNLIKIIVKILNPTANILVGDLLRAPYRSDFIGKEKVCSNVDRLLEIHKEDWNQVDTSWGFKSSPLIDCKISNDTLESSYKSLEAKWLGVVDEAHRLEEQNNQLLIDAYGLGGESSPNVSLHEITLNCNSIFRYGARRADEERRTLLCTDTMIEFVSYAVGCMFGRYSLDESGLILANQGETLADYLARVPEPTFMPDEDNVIPILDRAWFTDDIVERFHDFLRLTFGQERFQENLEYIEYALGKPLRKYFLRNFYKDHVKRYKKRPIYWLFSSPKGSFNALIYMHRYQPDTVSVILNDYLREFRTKLDARIAHLEQIENSGGANARDKTAAMKESKKLRDTVAELEDWERKCLLPLASEKIEIHLDDGVKANYPKFGQALAKIPGLTK